MTPWTKQEDNVLIENADSAYITSKLPGRSLEAIRKRARELGFFLFQGTWTLQKICRETGYNWKQVQRAKKSLKQAWKKESGGKSSRFVIQDWQVDAIVEFLANEKTPFCGTRRDGTPFPKSAWSTHFDRCQRCGTQGTKTTQRHAGRGLCFLCNRHLRGTEELEKYPKIRK